MKLVLSLVLTVLLYTSLMPAAQAADPDFRILPGDILQITVWKEEGMDREVIVLPDGTITFPLLGTVKIQDMTMTAAQEYIKTRLADSIPDASVTVAIKNPMGHKINVLGQVQKPGEFMLTSRLSVMQALSQAGGLTPYASESKIIIIRQSPKGKESIEFPYNDVSKGRHLEKDIDLKPGDVIMVPTAGIL